MLWIVRGLGVGKNFHYHGIMVGGKGMTIFYFLYATMTFCFSSLKQKIFGLFGLYLLPKTRKPMIV